MDRVTAELALELLGRALGDHLAAVDDRHALGELVGLLEVVGGQQHGLATLAGQLRDLGPHVGSDLGVEAGCRLIQEQDGRVVDHRHRDVQATLHPAAVAPGDPVGGVGQAEPLEQFLGALLERGAAHSVELALQTQVLAAGGLDVDRRALRDDADAPAHAVGVGDHIEPVDERPPGIGLGQRGQDLHGGRLAGAVGAEQREHAPRCDRERQPIERRHPLRIRLTKALGLDCMFHELRPPKLEFTHASSILVTKRFRCQEKTSTNANDCRSN